MTAGRRISPFVASKIRTLDAELAAAIPRVLGTADDEAIHDLRVAIRRLRTMLKLVRRVYGGFHADAVRRAFTDVQRATGELRDEEVLEQTLDDAHVDHPSFLEWRARRRSIERRLRRAVVVRLEKGDLSRARAMLKALLALPVRPKRDRDLAKFARKCVGRARKVVDGQRDVPVDDVDGLHRLRIAYKELRYASELLEGALPADLAALADPASRFQKRLGELHDVDVAIATANRARGLDPEARHALLLRLGEMRAKRVAKFLAEMNPAAFAPDPAASSPAVAPEPIRRNGHAEKRVEIARNLTGSHFA
jgi:CHAD domain-containing protein